jgi:radical SAM protein with 4Fe4S-binding SPASM domain
MAKSTSNHNFDIKLGGGADAKRARRAEWPRFGSPEVGRYGALGLTDEEIALDRKPVSAGGAIQSSSTIVEKSSDGLRDVFTFERSEPLPLVGHLAHHKVDEDNLWIAVEDGKIIVADDQENAVIEGLIAGVPPIDVAMRLAVASGIAEQEAWTVTIKLLARLAAAGMIEGVRGYHSIKKVRPEAFARFHLTQRCQLECIHCYTNSGPHLSSERELPVARWIDLVDAFADNGGEKILFTGGEALVYRGCIEVMRRAHERGLEVTLFSNGILVPRYLDDLKNVVDIVQISVDGPDERTHDKVRGPGSYRKAIRAIRLLLDADIETRVSTTIMVNNWPAIQQGLRGLIAEFANTKLSFRVSYGAMPHGRGATLDHNLDTEAVRRFVDDLLSRVNTTENRDAGVNVVQKITGCGYAEQLVVAPDGLIYPCHLLSGALGHVDQMPLPDITNYLKRTAEAFSVKNRKGCSTCDLRNLCGGTCRVEDEKRTGSRLITTCTPEDKLRKKRFLVRRYRAVPST